MKTKIKKQIELPFSGFYNTIHDIDHDTYEGKDLTDTEYSEYQKNYATAYASNLVELVPFLSEPSNVQVDSPRYYNYRNDEILADVKIDKEKLLEVFNDNIKGFAQFIKNNVPKGYFVTDDNVTLENLINDKNAMLTFFIHYLLHKENSVYDITLHYETIDKLLENIN